MNNKKLGKTCMAHKIGVMFGSYNLPHNAHTEKIERAAYSV